MRKFADDLMEQIEKAVFKFQMANGTCPTFIWQMIKEEAEKKLSFGDEISKMKIDIKARKL